MPWFGITYAPDVIRDLSLTDSGTAQRLLDKTKWLASNVGNLRHEPLTSDLPQLSKYAVGDWRIFYSINREERVLEVHMISHRKDLQ
jgi:mRNA interferase RelE/StbE